MEIAQEPPRARSTAARFFLAPLSIRSYANLLYLFTAFPLGLLYFILLSVGVSLGFGLLVIVVGLPILALVMLMSWGLVSVERQLAIRLLGAEVPPMSPRAPLSPIAPPSPIAATDATDAMTPVTPVTPKPRLWDRSVAFLSNPVAWKGIAYLLVKFPLGVLTFCVSIFLVALSGSLIAAPILYRLNDFDFDGTAVTVLPIDTLGGALVCMVVGLVVGLLSINALNGIAWLWKQLATSMLGSRRFAVPVAAPAVQVA